MSIAHLGMKKADIRVLTRSSDGRTDEIILPSAMAQAAAIRAAYLKAGLSPNDTDYIEVCVHYPRGYAFAALNIFKAHGTGTAVGDRIEIEGLSHVFFPRTNVVPLYTG